MGACPLDNFWFLDVLRLILLLFGTRFYSKHGATADTELGCFQAKNQQLVRAIRFTDATFYDGSWSWGSVTHQLRANQTTRGTIIALCSFFFGSRYRFRLWQICFLSRSFFSRAHSYDAVPRPCPLTAWNGGSLPACGQFIRTPRTPQPTGLDRQTDTNTHTTHTQTDYNNPPAHARGLITATKLWNALKNANHRTVMTSYNC